MGCQDFLVTGFLTRVSGGSTRLSILGLNTVALPSTVAKLYKLLSTKDRAAESTKGKRDTTGGVKKCEEKKGAVKISPESPITSSRYAG